MRITSFAAVLLATLFAASTVSAQETRVSVQGFGGVGLGSFTSVNTNFGGVVSGDLTPNIQVLGEVGRLSNILPTRTQSLFDLSPVAFNASAFYAQGDDGLGIAASVRRGFGRHRAIDTARDRTRWTAGCVHERRSRIPG
jgi:hypothetical protein